MPGGPFASFNANFNASLTATPDPVLVPVPGAVWLFGSGLLGLNRCSTPKEEEGGLSFSMCVCA